jgi:uncharacterized protein
VRTIPATELRVNLFETLKRVGYEREPVLIERRGRPIAALVPPEAVDAAKSAAPVSRQPARPAIDPKALAPKALADFCARHQVKTLYLFGSVLTDQFDEESDVDVMFEPESAASPGLFEQMGMADELQELFGRPVDIVSRSAVEAMPNAFRKRSILETARIVYGR